MALKKSDNLKSNIENLDVIKAFYMLKLITFYFTILSTLKTMPFEIGESLNEIISISIKATPSEEFEIFSFECALKRLDIRTPSIFSMLL
jgi:hypothetical protein